CHQTQSGKACEFSHSRIIRLHAARVLSILAGMPGELIRLIHVVSSALMFGVGIGAFWFVRASLRSADVAAIAVNIRNAVRAEWFIAGPVAVIQPATGYLLMLQLDYSLRSRWFLAFLILYILAGMFCVYLLKAELGMRALAAASLASPRAATPLPPQFHTLARRWQYLALGSIAGVLAIFWLMVFRPGL
ncbi:MAG: DUF2269 domain-containing protein, partial [Gammaproteobacteria bacterium]|nr:DUF2269 domain-containing protein [Gammaproteobacteria bacterium]